MILSAFYEWALHYWGVWYDLMYISGAITVSIFVLLVYKVIMADKQVLEMKRAEDPGWKEASDRYEKRLGIRYLLPLIVAFLITFVLYGLIEALSKYKILGS